MKIMITIKKDNRAFRMVSSENEVLALNACIVTRTNVPLQKLLSVASATELPV